MSQAKVEKYKKEKANRKKVLAQNKSKRLAGRICAWVILAAVAGWAGYSGYRYYESKKPAETFYADLSPVSDYLNALNTEAE